MGLARLALSYDPERRSRRVVNARATPLALHQLVSVTSKSRGWLTLTEVRDAATAIAVRMGQERNGTQALLLAVFTENVHHLGPRSFARSFRITSGSDISEDSLSSPSDVLSGMSVASESFEVDSPINGEDGLHVDMPHNTRFNGKKTLATNIK